MDLNRDVTYRGFTLNDSSILAASNLHPGRSKGLAGCVIDTVQISDVDVQQWMEKRSQADGFDSGPPFLGVRRIRMAGTLYDVSRPLLFDRLRDLRAALSPVLASREEPLDHGFRPLGFVWATDDTTNFPTGMIDVYVNAMPRAEDNMFTRDASGGDDDDPLAIPWQATFICANPGIYGLTPLDFPLTAQTLVTGATGQNAGDTITKNGHGLVNDDRVRFVTLTGGTGLGTTTTYYVVNKTTNTFQVATTSGGAAVPITADYSTVTYVKSVTTSANFTNRGNYLSTVNALFEVGAASGTISLVIGDTNCLITVPASTGTRTIRFKGADKVLTLEEDSVELPRLDLITFNNDTTWPYIDPGDGSLSVTIHGCISTANSHVWFYEQYA